MWGTAVTALRGLGFRFAVVLVALRVLPFPFIDIDPIEAVAERYWGAWEPAVRASGDLLGIAIPARVPTGSGDTAFDWTLALLHLVIAAIAAGAWFALDRGGARRDRYPRVGRTAFTVLRYWLAMNMWAYGLAKVFDVQFYAPPLTRLIHPAGELSPMGLLWTFMGYSRPYTMFAGFAECAAGALLLARRTTTLGALIACAVMANVVMLNFSYDVGVKLHSSSLLIAAIALVVPDARRLIGAVLGGGVPAKPVAVRDPSRFARARSVAAWVVVLAYVGVLVMQNASYARIVANDHRSPLVGMYDVDAFVRDGETVPLDPARGERWREVAFDYQRAYIRWMDGRNVLFGAPIDSAHHTVTLRELFARTPGGAVFTYERAANGVVTLDGSLDRAVLHVVLRPRDVSQQLLFRRGFHWIQEQPFNR